MTCATATIGHTVRRVLALQPRGLLAPAVGAAQKLALVLARRVCRRRYVDEWQECTNLRRYGCRECGYEGWHQAWACDCGEAGYETRAACPRCGTERWRD